jgi:hypothetical protein
VKPDKALLRRSCKKGDEVMGKSTKTIELKLERTIPASSSEVYDAWLNPKIPESAYSDEGNQCSRLIVISVPGWCDQSSERSDAGFCIL